ncbi:MAG: hypothetical protein HUU41_07880 [Bryobacteraceae bacterium]|nr:hypothetical protein [Bryobacterales bacterium]NUN01018.1 hypothetical protein [Bryobacteraceae bacterium]
MHRKTSVRHPEFSLYAGGSRVGHSGHRMLAAALVAVLPTAVWAQQAPSTDPAPTAVQRGAGLFTGKIPLRNQGPACVGCHTIAGLPFPNGGTLGPDLTDAYRKLGPEGTHAAMQTLYFRVMTPVYRAHTLTQNEQADLVAFLADAGSSPAPRWNTQILLLMGLGLAAVFVALTGLVWRDRVRSVRRALVLRATRQGVRS